MWLLFKLREELDKIKQSIISKDQINLMIENAILKNNELHELNPQTPQTNPQTKLRKRADKLLNKAELLQEIASLEQLEYSTTDSLNEIVNIKQLCKKSSFFKFLKIVRENNNKLHELTSQTTRTKKTN